MIFAEPALGSEDSAVLSLIQSLWAEMRINLQHRPRRWGGLLARNLRARAIQGSNSIEGYVVSQEDALAAVDGDSPEEAADDTWAAVTGYRDAMNYVLRLGDADDFAYDGSLLRSLHFMMVRHDPRSNPGTWRPGTIYVKNDASGEIVYEGPPRDEVPGLVRELCGLLTQRDGDVATRMVRAAMAHLNLVMIHPFSDGNGRMARCLQTLVLARGGLLDPTFSSIEEYLGRNTRAYYDILAEVGQGRWTPRRESLPWLRFCLTAHYRQGVKARRRLDSIAEIGQAVEGELVRLGLPDRAAVSLTNAALGLRIRNEAYRRDADVSLVVASRDLKSLVEAALLVPRGANRGRSYEAGSWLVTLRARFRDTTPIPSPFEVVRPKGRRRSAPSPGRPKKKKKKR